MCLSYSAGSHLPRHVYKKKKSNQEADFSLSIQLKSVNENSQTLKVCIHKDATTLGFSILSKNTSTCGQHWLFKFL